MKTIVYNEMEQVLFCEETSEPVVNVIDVAPIIAHTIVALIKGGADLNMVEAYLFEMSGLPEADHNLIIESLRVHNEPLKKWSVPVTKTSHSHRTIKVEAKTEQEALQKANDVVGGHKFLGGASKYTFPDGATEIE